MKITEQQINQQIKEMWDAADNITDYKQRNIALNDASNRERELRQQLEKQNQLEEAAPDLLEALQGTIKLLKNSGFSSNDFPVEVAEIAIKKATT